MSKMDQKESRPRSKKSNYEETEMELTDMEANLRERAMQSSRGQQEVSVQNPTQNKDPEPTEQSEENEENKTKRPLWQRILFGVLRVVGLLSCLYIFVISLDLMSSAFQLVFGRSAAQVLSNSTLFNNPVAGLMIGVIFTVLVQSSSTSTSIVVSMVGAGILKLRPAIPIIMGANIGTSVTSVLVSLGQITDKEKFRRSFAGATIHDTFNLLSVIILLPLEVVSHYLEVAAEGIVGPEYNSTKADKIVILQAITNPVSELIIELDKNVLDLIAQNLSTPDQTIIKHWCQDKNNATIQVKCKFLFEPVNWEEWVVGLVLLIISLVLLCGCLIILVKLLSSVFQGPIAKLLKEKINKDFPGPFKYFTGYVAILIGCGLTIVVQSSSVFMSTLNPMIGLGVVSIERVFPLTLGANIGTTITGLLAALSTNNITVSLKIALCHTLFNITGIVIWYPIPYFRQVPLRIAGFLGNTVAEYRWFAIFYLIFVFLLVPLFLFGLSLAGDITFYIVLGIIILLLLMVGALNLLQSYLSRILPSALRDWTFLPEFMRSLRPYDAFLMNYICVCKCCGKLRQIHPNEDEKIEAVVMGDKPDDKPVTKQVRAQELPDEPVYI